MIINFWMLVFALVLLGFLLVIRSLSGVTEMIEMFSHKMIAGLCWMMSMLPLPSPLSRDEWRDLAKMFNGESLPDERKNYLKAKIDVL